MKILNLPIILIQDMDSFGEIMAGKSTMQCKLNISVSHTRPSKKTPHIEKSQRQITLAELDEVHVYDCTANNKRMYFDTRKNQLYCIILRNNTQYSIINYLHSLFFQVEPPPQIHARISRHAFQQYGDILTGKSNTQLDTLRFLCKFIILMYNTMNTLSNTIQ